MTQQTLLGRVGQLVKANLNDLLDHAEDPEKMLDQLVRDYTNAISEARDEVAVVIGNLRATEDDAREAAAAAEEWGRKGTAASHKAEEEGTDTAHYNDLARIAFTKQVAYEKQAETLAAKVASDTVVVDNLKDGLTKMETKLDTLRDKRQELVSRAKMVQAQKVVLTATSAVDAADPTSDIARFEDRIKTDEAQVRGYAELQSESIDEQFAALDSDAAKAEVEARLAASKAKAPA